MTNQECFEHDLEILNYGEWLKGELSGYCFAIVRTSLGHLCGYVKVSDYENINFELGDIFIECHGGITYDRSGEHYFSESGRYIGFDCAHAGDWLPDLNDGKYRDIAFVMLEIRHIINQLEDLKNG